MSIILAPFGSSFIPQSADRTDISIFSVSDTPSPLRLSDCPNGVRRVGPATVPLEFWIFVLLEKTEIYSQGRKVVKKVL